MSTGVSGWWASRSLAWRVTLIATVALALGLVTGAVGLATLFFHSRLDAVDANVRTETATLTSLLRSGQLPDPLPVPAGQPLLAQVIDASGQVQASSPAASREVPLLLPAELRAQESGVPFTTTRSSLGSAPLRVIVTASQSNGAPVDVVSAVPFTDVGGTLAAMLRTLVIAVPVVLLAAAIATWLAVTSALRPVDELRAAAEEVAASPGQQPPRLPEPPSRDELARLASTLNRMLERLHLSAEQQRSFVADAAHELRSPIAAIRTQLEVALSTPTDAAGWAVVGADVLDDVKRVGTLAEDMLMLARLDSGASLRRGLVDLDDLFGLRTRPLWVDGDPVALRRAFDNLVANAERHAQQDVSVTGERVDNDVLITIDDDGAGIAPIDRERVFERWLRLDDARARDDGGAGLGLAIARAVARTHGGDVTLADSPLGGVRAQLRLPAATHETP